MNRDTVLYLSSQDVLACGLRPEDINDAVEAAFLDSARGRANTKPALSIQAGNAASFRAKGAVLDGCSFGALKWYGYFPGNAAEGRAEYRPLILLNEARSGMPVAILNGDWITATRTAAITAVGAKYLADPAAKRVAFIGTGGQARANLLALLPRFSLGSIVACGRRTEPAEAFAAFARTHGVAAEITTDPRRAVADAQIVVTTVPRLSPVKHFLDAAWLAPGTFVSMVDSGVSWSKTGLGAFARCVADDVEQSTHNAELGDATATFDAGLADVVGGLRPGRRPDGGPVALIFSGTGLADAAAAVAVYESARAKGLGQILPM